MALNDTNWPKYLAIETVKNCRSLRTENTMKVTLGETNCYSNQALVFNELPKSVRYSPTVDSFEHEEKKHYMEKALARPLSMQVKPPETSSGHRFYVDILEAS